ncbi:argininosuccinate lyase [Aggregicoccus sp. 17bor-14]|uniref:argininosuccinate lyase n=1 Tax=Myxococcaceae TaxID=31 RepID=UPI00129D0D52|nr:argininosuccinate lyase [Simulacricoccus sp. 17bor-14]MRI89013.1 argininosuccinate lyase [Aggregicoccus sp. 17bor-14]
MAIAKTDASGGSGLLPEVLHFTSSLALDRQLLREDLVGSLAHLTMLARVGILPKDKAGAIHAGLVRLYAAQAKGELQLPDEEDVHMAVEALLTRELGETAGLLHSARSRNDQVALDLRLHVREACAQVLDGLAALVEKLVARAKGPEGDIVLPSYTHRQRAQPITLSYWLSAYAAMFARDAEAFGFVLQQADALPLGVGAIAGSSLPIDREVTRGLLQFSRVTLNGLDTVGDRDFALDYVYAAARLALHASRFAADLVDFASAEFGFVKLAGDIACGSSMMPQKRNPDVFELVRGKSGRAVGSLVELLVTLKGLPGGYNRDLQEDRQVLLETLPRTLGVLSILGVGLDGVTFDRARCQAAIDADATQATDVAEALVKKGVAFRTAYGLVGTLVRRLQEAKVPLAQVTLAQAQEVDPRFDAEVLEAARPQGSVARKQSVGSTGPASVKHQLQVLQTRAAEIRTQAAGVPRIDQLFQSLKEASL